MIVFLNTIVVFLGLHSSADSTAVQDSIRAHEVVVIADPWQASGRGAIQSLVSFTRQQLQTLAPSQARDVLSLVPGVFVRDYGGAGTLQTVSFRGGSSSQALVLIDGARLSSAQNGSADISMIPMRFVSSVEATRGGSSARYGANALSGVVDLRLRLPKDDATRFSAMGGSFDQWALSAGTTKHIGKQAIGLDVEHMGSMGSFPFIADQFGSTYEVNRQNNDVRSTRLMLRAEQPSAYSATVLVRSLDRGVPGAVVQGSITQARARMRDADAIGHFSAVVSSSPQTSQWEWVGSLRYLDQSFSDPDATIVGTQGIDVRYIQRDVTQGLVGDYDSVLEVADGLVSLQGRFDVSYADIRGQSLQGADDLIHRASAATTLHADYAGSGIDAVRVRSAVRTEYFTDIGLIVSPLLGVHLPLSNMFSMRALWSYNVRPPSFNELYYLNYGTSDLLPERSSTSEMALHMQPTEWLDADVTAYYMSTRDLIVSVPVSPVITSARNVGSAHTYGIEFVARAAAFDQKLRLQYSYAFMQARDATGRRYLDGTYLPYAPPEVLSALIMWTDTQWYTSATVSYTSFRYHSTGNVYASLLHPYTLVGLQGGVRVRTNRSDIDVRVQCENLLDASYVVVRGFPMPGRTVRLVVAMELGQ